MSFGDELRKAMDNETIEPPKGPYKARLDEASAFTGKQDKEYAKVTLLITAGEHEGARFEHWMRFGSPQAKAMSAEALAAYGVNLSEIETVDDIDAQLRALVAMGTDADVSVSYGGDEGQFLNVKVHGSRTASPTSSDTTPATASNDFAAAAAKKFGDDVPFD